MPRFDGEILDSHGRPADTAGDRVIREARGLLVQLRSSLAESVREANPAHRFNEAYEVVREEDMGSHRLNASPWSQVMGGVFNMPVGAGGYYNHDAASNIITFGNANNYSPISMNQIVLNFGYMTNGFLRTVVKEPVDDAFRGGVEFKSAELSADELRGLARAMKRVRSRRAARQAVGTLGSRLQYNAGTDLQRSDMSAIKHVGYWGRLFGGSGLIINCDQDFTQDFDPEALGPDSPLEYIPADRWQLTLNQPNLWSNATRCPFTYFGLPLNASRVLPFVWNEAPNFLKLRFMGWGMSEVEHCIRPINAFLKFENLLFELLDQAKIDFYKLDGFRATRASGNGMEQVRMAMDYVNRMKNFENAVVMDKEDDFQQKQLTFSGLAEIRAQGRLDLCSALRFPINKLFGDSATGFGGGQDAMENYNAMVSTMREEIEPLVIYTAQLRSQQLYGVMPEDLEAVWRPLREMSGPEEEQVKTGRSARTLAWFQAGLLTDKEAVEQGKKEGVVSVDTEIEAGRRTVSPTPVAEPGARPEPETEEEDEGNERANGVRRRRKR